jgi:hypothetical protein
MNTYELIAKLEKECRDASGISTPDSYRKAGEKLLQVLHSDIFKTGTVLKPECRMTWDHLGRIITETIKAQMQVAIDRSSGTVQFFWPIYDGTIQDYVYNRVVAKYADISIQDSLARCSPAMRRTFINLLK